MTETSFSVIYPPKGEDLRPTKLIQFAIKCLPKEVKAFFYENPVTFQTLPPRIHGYAFYLVLEELKPSKYFIYLYGEIWSYKDCLCIQIIFHELAHCFLKQKHTGINSFKNKHYKKLENEAERLVKKWMVNANLSYTIVGDLV